VKVRYGEGVATHTDPESCGAYREVRVEALAGERIGQPLSREILLRGADAFETAEGHTDGDASASCRPTLRGLRPWHVRTLLAREPGDLRCGHRQAPSGPHREGLEPKPMMHATEKSDSCVVPTNRLNNARLLAAEAGEGRRLVAGSSGGKARSGHRAGLRVMATL